ncbi:hypothetical protein D3C72_1394390 [compost metagenome]
MREGRGQAMRQQGVYVEHGFGCRQLAQGGQGGEAGQAVERLAGVQMQAFKHGIGPQRDLPQLDLVFHP